MAMRRSAHSRCSTRSWTSYRYRCWQPEESRPRVASRRSAGRRCKRSVVGHCLVGLSGGADQRRVSPRTGRGPGDSNTTSTRVFDIVRGLPWSERFPSRVLRNDFVARWAGHEDALADDPEAQAELAAAVDADDRRPPRSTRVRASGRSPASHRWLRSSSGSAQGQKSCLKRLARGKRGRRGPAGRRNGLRVAVSPR